VKLLDTSVAVDHLRGVPAAAALLDRAVRSGEPVLASELTRFELLAGVRDDEVDTLESFFSALTWVPVDEHVARVAGRLTRRYRRSHVGIDAVDYLIAATALVLGAELVTTNTRHFPMLRGLRPPY
jgi:hypothetical protein